MVRKEKAVDKKIKEICLNYMALMIQCANNKELKDRFTDPENFEFACQILREQVGMKIPKDVKIFFDDHEWRWPIFLVRATNKEGKTKRFVIEEKAFGASVYGDSYYQELEEYIKDKDPNFKHKDAEVHIKGVEVTEPYKRLVDIHIDDMDVKEVRLILTFFDIDVDMLTDIKYDESEIVLTPCS